jgi:hypothetical protein
VHRFAQRAVENESAALERAQLVDEDPDGDIAWRAGDGGAR